MMNYCKKEIHKNIIVILSVILILIVGLLIIAKPAYASEIVASGDCGGNGSNVTWTLDDEGTLTISGEGEMHNWSPYSLDPDNVSWQSHVKDIKNVFIDNGVTSIGSYSFLGCSNLTNIRIPEGLAEIGDEAFKDCSSIANILIPESLNYIGFRAFEGCRSLTGITIPEGLTRIWQDTFKDCSSLTSITIPKGVNYIGTYAFSGCSRLTDITIPEGVTEIGYSAFKDCISIKSITIPEGVTSIGDSIFSGCINLKSVTLPEGLDYIGWSAFNNCSNLTNIRIPEGVTYLCPSIFYNCSSLTSITLPESITTIRESAFYGCSSLTGIMIPEGVTRIEPYAFSNCSSLVSINIPVGVANIENGVFSYCKNLTNITIPEQVTSIGNYAFSNCSSLTNITLPKEVISIGDYAFYNCDKLTSITIPEGVTNIGIGAFSGCKSFTSITIPEGVTSIGDYTFYNCDKLTSIVIPEGVTNIGERAFSTCYSLANIILPDSVTSIGPSAFDPISYDYIAYVFPGSYADSVFPADHKKYLYTDETTNNKYISYKYDRIVLKPGDVLTLSGYYDTNIAPENITVTIDNTSLFIYDSGKIAALKEGESSLTLSDGEVSESIKLVCTSKGSDITGLSLRDNALDLSKGQIVTEQISFSPGNALSKDVTWTSSDTSVVSVDSGRLEAVGVGTATVKAALTENPDIFDICEVTVTDTLKAIVTFDESFYRILIGETEKLNYYIYPYGTDIPTIKYESSDPDIISIDANGYMTAHKSGTAEIMISAGTLSKTIRITVCVPLEGISLDRSSAQIECDNQIQLNVTFVPEDTSERNVVWTSSNEEIATVDENGLVTPKGNGIVTITAEAGKYAASCNIVSLGHDWGEWTVTKKATANEEGVETRVCKRDPSHIETRTIPRKEGAFKGVIRIYDYTRYGTSIQSAYAYMELLGGNRFDAVIIACGTNYADALAGSYLSTVKEAPILLVRNNPDEINHVERFIKRNLKSDGTIYLLGGSAVVPDAATAGLSGYNVKRLWGADRYATNVAILEEAGVSGDEIIVASGTGFADSLSASATGKPILLVKNVIQPSQKAYVESLKGKKFYLIGGTGAVNSDIEKYFSTLGSVTRLGGATRFDTSVKVAETFFENPTGAVLAYGQDFPDGLCGGSFANAMGGPLLLATSSKSSQAAAYAKTNGIRYGAVLGGPTLINDAAVRSIFQMSGNTRIAGYDYGLIAGLR